MLVCSPVIKGMLYLTSIGIRNGTSEAFQQVQAARCKSPTYLRHTNSLALFSTLNLSCHMPFKLLTLASCTESPKRLCYSQKDRNCPWDSSDGQFQLLGILNLWEHKPVCSTVYHPSPTIPLGLYQLSLDKKKTKNQKQSRS